jgi:hypothetical protein
MSALPAPADARDDALAKLMFSLRRALVERRQVIEIGERKLRFQRRNEEFDEGETTYQALASGIFLFCSRSQAGKELTGVWLHLGSSDDLEDLLAEHLRPMSVKQLEELRVTISANAALQSLVAARLSVRQTPVRAEAGGAALPFSQPARRPRP